MKTLARFTMVVGIAVGGCRTEPSPEPMTVPVEFAELGENGDARSLLDPDANPHVYTVVKSASATVSVGYTVHSGPLLILGEDGLPKQRSIAVNVDDLDFRAWTAQRVGKRVAIVIGD